MRLWYHPESDALFWAGELGGDADSALCEDMTDEPRAMAMARERGLVDPRSKKSVSGEARGVIDAMATWDRKPSDFYPTPVDVTQSLLPLLEIMRVKHIWEPACGDGRMTRVLEAAGFKVTSTDLRHHSGYGVGGFDFLKGEPLRDLGWFHEDDLDMIVTNPPFKHALAFIRKALEYTPNVAMLLKGTYWHAANRYKLFQEQRPSFWLPLTWRPAFLEAERGKSPLMEVGWAVWTDKETGYGLDGNACLMEPLLRLAYPGYAGLGIRSAMDILEGELEALALDLAAMRK